MWVGVGGCGEGVDRGWVIWAGVGVGVGGCGWVWVRVWVRVGVGGRGWVMWVGVGGCGWVWVGVGGCEWVWVGVGGCGWWVGVWSGSGAVASPSHRRNQSPPGLRRTGARYGVGWGWGGAKYGMLYIKCRLSVSSITCMYPYLLQLLKVLAEYDLQLDSCVACVPAHTPRLHLDVARKKGSFTLVEVPVGTLHKGLGNRIPAVLHSGEGDRILSRTLHSGEDIRKRHLPGARAQWLATLLYRMNFLRIYLIYLIQVV